MSQKPWKQCLAPGCVTLCRGEPRCEKHRRGSKADNRPNAYQRGYTKRWAKAAKAYLRNHPLCVYCKIKGRVQAAECVDHHIPHKGDQTLFWDRDNWRASCISCNSRKGDRHPGGGIASGVPVAETDAPAVHIPERTRLK